MYRWILTSVLIVLALLFAAVTLTVPAISATAPALITIGLCVGIYFAWPKKHKETTTGESASPS